MNGEEPFELDPAALSRLEGLGGRTLMAQIFALVLEQGPQRLVKAREGYQQGDLAAVRMAAHSMCSSAGNIGATRLLALSRQVEDLVCSGPLEQPSDELPGALAALEAEWLRVQTWLEDWRGRA